MNNDQVASFLIAALGSSIAAVNHIDFSEISNTKTCVHSTLGMCVQSLESTENYLDSSISHLELVTESNSGPRMEDVLPWLRATVTYLTTCMDEMLFRTSTVAIDEDGFLAKDVTFQNTAGAENHQAVATRVDSDKSAFYRCSFEGYQDTLHAQSLRQFFQSCTVYGTVDFIFNKLRSSVPKLQSRLPKTPGIPREYCDSTEQNVSDQDTGFSFQTCLVTAAPEVASVITSTTNQSIQSFLGRPWQEYSRTVFMETYMMDVINAAGWVEWNETDFTLATLYFGEYQNVGTGGSFTHPVVWATKFTDPEVAAQYSISFISGHSGCVRRVSPLPPLIRAYYHDLYSQVKLETMEVM